MTSAEAPKSNGRRRGRPEGILGAKLLLSALALVATLTGWVRLATLPDPYASATPVPPTTAVEPVVQSVEYSVPPMPTLVPLIAAPKAGPRRAQPAPAAQQAGASMPALTALRVVSAPPPAPQVSVAAVSRSSR